MNRKKGYFLGILACLCFAVIFIIYFIEKQTLQTPDNTISENDFFKTLERTTNVDHLEGKGTKENPYLIHTLDEMNYFAAQIEAGNEYENQYIKMENNIDFSQEDNWVPISGNFMGIFDGAGWEITNLYSEHTSAAGLFSKVSGIICNLSISDGTVSGNTCGGIAVSITDTGAVLNCSNTSLAIGDIAGGIAGENKGRIVNCVNLVDKKSDGAQKIAGDTEDEKLENCYTNRGGYFELSNISSAEVDAVVFNNAITNLNNRIQELTIEYPGIRWFHWELLDNKPQITEEQANTVTEVLFTNAYGKQESIHYSLEEHGWCIEPQEEMPEAWQIQLVFQDGNKQSLECKNYYDQIFYEGNGIENIIILDQNKIVNGKENLSTENFDGIVNFDDLAILDEKSEHGMNEIQVIPRIYLDQNGNKKDEDHLVILKEKINYQLKGNLYGQVIIDVDSDNLTKEKDKAEKSQEKITLTLQGINIENKYGPSVLVKNAPESQDAENAGVALILENGSENFINGSNCMDIYSAEHKNEGAISSEVTISISGDTGTLNVNGDLEGIETAGQMGLFGGNYYITSVDDALNADDKILMTDGYWVINGGDDVVDSNKKILYKSGTLIGYTPIEHILNSPENHFDGGMIVGTAVYKNYVDLKSKQGLLEIRFPEKFNPGQYILMTDNNDQPILALETKEEGKKFEVSIPNMKGNTYHFYWCSNIEGKWKDGLCQEIDTYTIDEQIMTAGSADFFMEEVDTFFEVDEEQE